MRTPSKEELDNYIFSIGFEEAIKLFCISEKKAENILFASPQKIKDTPEDETYYLELPVTIDQDHVAPLFSCIKVHYFELKKHFAGENDGLTINKHSKSVEDLFHDALIYIIETYPGLPFDDPDHILIFIKSRIFSRKRSQQKKLNNDKTEFIQLKEALISYLSEEEETAPINSVLSNARIIIDHALHQSTKKAERAII